MWIAVLGSVKLFPNLEAALKGVFNRVLKNLRKASALLGERRKTVEQNLKCSPSFRENRRGKNARVPFAFQSRASRHPLRSFMLWSSCQNELNDDTGDALRAAGQPGFAIDL